MTSYTHRAGQVVEDGYPITLAVASERLAAATLGAAHCRRWGANKTAEVSEQHVRELKAAIAAAAAFNALMARRGRPSTGVAVSPGNAA